MSPPIVFPLKVAPPPLEEGANNEMVELVPLKE